MTFNKIVIILFLINCMLVASPTLLHAVEIVNGTHIGWKQLPDLSPHDKSEKWYREHTLKIKGNNLSIEASPRSVKNGGIMYSASTGGFYSYEGTIFNKNNKKYVRIKIISCDYCPRPINGNFPENDHEIIMKDQLTFVINNVFYVFQKPEDN